MDDTASGTIVKWSIIAGFAIMMVLCFAFMRINTLRAIEQASQFLSAGPAEGELRAVYGTPSELYASWSEVPGKFQRGIVESADCEYHLYTLEGFPYWYFVVAVDRTTRVIEHGVATNY